MKHIYRLINIYTAIMLCVSASSCRPPTFAETYARNPNIQRDQELAGQSLKINFEIFADGRPEHIRNADNPEYKRDSNVVIDTFNWVFGGSDNPPQQQNGNIDIPPQGPEHYDNYDIKNGKINTGSTALDPNDPEVKALRESAQNTENSFGSRQFLLDQRDYAKSRSQQLVEELNKAQIAPFSKDIEKQLKTINSDIDTYIRDHNANVDSVIEKIPEDQNLPKVDGYELKTAPYSENGLKVRTAQQSINYAKTVVAQMSGTAKDRGERAINAAQSAVITADKAYSAGDQEGGDYALEIAKTVLDVGLGLVPFVGVAKDAYEAYTGFGLVTGKKLSGFERSMAVVGVLTAGIGSKLALISKAAIITDVLKAGKTAEEGAEIAKVTSKAVEVVEAASKAGVKDKAIIEEVADIVKQDLPCVAAIHKSSLLLWLLEDTAYADNCIPGSVEKRLIETFEAAKKWGVPEKDIPRVANGANHVFGVKNLAEHKLGGFLGKFDGDSVGAFKSLENAAQGLADSGKINGLFRDVVVNVKDIDVTLRGNVIEGVAKLSTAFIP